MASTTPAASTLEQLLEQMVEAGLVSAVVGLIAGADEIAWVGCGGRTGGSDHALPVPESLFDLASLTKPWTATLALVLSRIGRLSLGSTLGEYWPAVDERLTELPLELLLRHQAGFRPWAPLYHLCGQRQQVERLLLDGSLLADGSAYSDLGFILWGLSAEALLGSSLTELLGQHVVPLTGSAPAVSGYPAPERIVSCSLDGSTELALAREQGLRITAPPPPGRGQVQDGNARFLGGLAGHAGLFGSATMVWELARLWLAPRAPLDRASIDRALAGTGPYALGWARRDASESAGEALSSASFGHTGFTGGSVWIDPDASAILILLAHRTSARVDLSPWRRRFHELALERFSS